jgi:hypothetical protein
MKVLSVSKQGALAPLAEYLPHLQEMLLHLILAAYRSDNTVHVGMMANSMLVESFKLIGIYDQTKIDEGVIRSGGDCNWWLLKEAYQRYAPTTRGSV